MKFSDAASAAVLTAAFLLLAMQAAMGQPVQPGEEGWLAKLVPPEPGAHACYHKSYDAAYLALHPDQTITDMELRLAYHRFEPNKNNPQGQRNYYFALVVKRRGETGHLTGMGECIPYGFTGISCGIDCDGGGLDIIRHWFGPLEVDLTPFGFIRMTRSCGDGNEEVVRLRPGTGDKGFELDPVPAEQCPAYEEW